MIRLARLIGCTEGQAYTLVIGAVLAVALILTGLPPALRRPEPVARAAASATREPPPVPIPGYTDDSALAPATTTSTPIEIAAPRLPAAPGLEAGTPRRARSTATTTTTAPVARGGGDNDQSPTTTTPSSPASGELAIRSAAYARAVGGNLTVPDGGLPVGARLGREDARTYLRLAGGGTTLRVPRHPDSSGDVFPGSARIAVCRVIPGDWELENGSSIADAPPIDTSSCVPGAAAADGSWSFPVASLGDVTDARGVALVAVLEASATFQVTFAAK